MQERTALFGGQLRIISNPYKGTTISLTIPITQKKND
jgi:signal transduction histidine kinase